MVNILAIDDDEKTTFLIEDLFKNIGHNIITRNSGREGISAFNKSGNIDIVITDIEMPGISGNEVARKIRKSRNRKKRKTPIIALTGSGLENVEKDLFNYVLEKPVKMNKLITTINTYSHN